jgi:hypothetical protein
MPEAGAPGSLVDARDACDESGAIEDHHREMTGLSSVHIQRGATGVSVSSVVVSFF